MTDIDLMAVLATVVNHIQRKAAGRRIHCEHTDDSLFRCHSEGVKKMETDENGGNELTQIKMPQNNWKKLQMP